MDNLNSYARHAEAGMLIQPAVPASAMDPSSLYPAPHPQTAGRVIEGEAVLHLSETNEIQVYNEVGSRIFELADGQRSLAEIAAVLTDEYNVDLNEALADVNTFVRQLIDNQVLVLNYEPRTD